MQVIFQREIIKISPPPPKTQTKAPAKKRSKNRPTFEFSGEVRGEEALQLEYIHTLNDLSEDDAVMIALQSPSIVSLPAFNVYKSVDVVFVDDDGKIIQITPNIVPAEITRDISADTPVRALIYLKAGLTKAFDIRPRDVVRHATFNAKPIVIQ